MKNPSIYIFLAYCATLLLFAAVSSAEQTGSVGFTYNEVMGDRSSGLTLDYERPLGPTHLEIEGSLQLGDVYKGQSHAELTFGVGNVGIKALADSTHQGYTITSLGRSTVLALALTVPVKNLNFDVGIGGKSAAPWGAPNLLDDAVAQGYDEAELNAIGAADITPKPRGLPLGTGNRLMALVETGFEKGAFEFDVRGVFELTGDTDKLHRVLASAQTAKNLFGQLDWTVDLQVGIAFYQEDVHTDRAVLTGISYKF